MESNEKNNKKAIITLVVGIGVLLVLIFSATFAYFSVTSRNNFGTKTITGTAEATGSVALNGTSTSLRLNLSGTDMMKGEDDITYWATSDGTPSTTQNIVTIGSTQVTGPGYYNCDYTLSVTGTGTNNMYTAFQGMSGKSTEQIVLKIGDTKYDFNTANLFPITINGTLNGVTGSSVKSLTAEFYIVNKETVVQDALAGKDLNITITATSFSCTAVEDPNNYLDKAKFKNHIKNQEVQSITFLNTTNVPEGTGTCDGTYDISEKQNGSIIMSVIDLSENCSTNKNVYIGQAGGVLAPPDSSYLLSGSIYNINNIQNFNTSHVTNMSHMFDGYGDSPTQSLNLSSFDTSNVTDMSFMFYDACIPSIVLSDWNTSNVTNMERMFNEFTFQEHSVLDLTSFDTSNVTNMEWMFRHIYGLETIDVSSFNTSNVEYMDLMFNSDFDLITIYASNSFVVNDYYDDMFTDCELLVGGNGTPYDYNYDDSTYARIDAPGTPGYFTLKTN